MYELKSDNPNEHIEHEGETKCFACGKYFIPRGAK